MMNSFQNIHDKNKAIFEDPLLSIMMGQWLGILPDRQRNRSLMCTYFQPIFPEQLLNKVSSLEMEQIEYQFAQFLVMLGVENDQYFIQNFQKEQNQFTCYLCNHQKELLIQFSFRQFIASLATFTIMDQNEVVDYQLMMDHHTKEMKITHYERKNPSMIEKISVMDYELYQEENCHITIHYPYLLQSINDKNKLIDTDLLLAMKKKKTSQSLLEVIDLVYYCLKEDPSFYERIQIEQSIPHIEQFDMKYGKIEKMILASSENEKSLSKYKCK